MADLDKGKSSSLVNSVCDTGKALDVLITADRDLTGMSTSLRADIAVLLNDGGNAALGSFKVIVDLSIGNKTIRCFTGRHGRHINAVLKSFTADPQRRIDLCHIKRSLLLNVVF